MELGSEAIAFAVKAHDGMRRKKGESPYILHPMEAAVIVGTMSDDQDLIAAAALHDVVEDAGITLDEVEARFGKRVRELVESLPHSVTFNLEIPINCTHICKLITQPYDQHSRIFRIFQNIKSFFLADTPC